MRLVIFGDRKFAEFYVDPNTRERINTGNYTILNNVIEACTSYKEGKFTEVISGCANGADTLGEKWARAHNLPILRYPADWARYGKGAGPVRNKQMAEIADFAIGFLSINSRGTADMIRTCRKLKVPLLVYHIESQEIKIFYPE